MEKGDGLDLELPGISQAHAACRVHAYVLVRREIRYVCSQRVVVSCFYRATRPSTMAPTPRRALISLICTIRILTPTFSVRQSVCSRTGVCTLHLQSPNTTLRRGTEEIRKGEKRVVSYFEAEIDDRQTHR